MLKLLNSIKNIDYNLISSTLDHIMHLPITYHHNRPVGDIVSRIYDLYYIKDFINELLFSSIIDILYIMFVMFFLFCLNRLLFVLIMIVSILYFIIYYFYRDKINAYILNTKESQSEANSGIIENLLGIDSIKNLGLENKFFKLQANKYYNYLNNNEKCLKEYLNYNSISKLIEIFGLCLMLFVSNVLIKNKIISFGNLFIFYSFYNYLFIIYKRIIDTDNLIINSKHAYNRISDLLNIDRENNTNNSKKFENEIKLSNFQININNNLIPNNKFNLKIKKGNSFFITGESGIGKSTIFKSIVKQYHSNNIFF